MIIRGIEYMMESKSANRRVIAKDRTLNQRDWFYVKAPFDFNYDHFGWWFNKNCIGYWRYPVGHTFWFSESQDVIRYSFDYYDISQSSELIV